MSLHKWFSKKKLLTFIFVITLLVAFFWYLLFRTVPDAFQQAGVDDNTRFKYSSIGSEATRGVPYWIWRVMPELFSEHLPSKSGSWSSIGLVWEQGFATPVGFSKIDIGIIPRIGINCAVCHAATYRKNINDTPTIIPAGPSQRFSLHAYQKFLYDAASDSRFHANYILPAIEKRTNLSFIERLLYRFFIIPLTRDALLKDKQAFDTWKMSKPDPGPGRIDPFNPIKFRRLQQPVDTTIGNADLMSIWNLNLRKNRVLHWDGTNPDVTEVIVSSAIGDGADPSSINIKQMDWLEHYLKELPSPKYPFAINQSLLDQGQSLYQKNCAACHAPEGKRTGTIIPIGEIQTDSHRLYMWEKKDADALNALYANYDWGFSHYEDTNGYASVPLDGIWLRAPYLHNGSVPTLTALLNKPELRPRIFYRGSDVYDPQKIGFQSDSTQNEQSGVAYFRYDVSVSGNSNQGHRYGVELSDADKVALLEYLKTL